MLALLKQETGSEVVASALVDGSVASPVNVAEVIAKLIDDGLSPEDAEEAFADIEVVIVDLDRQLGIAAGALHATYRRDGLSLADCVCLALTQSLEGTALTADRAWGTLDVDLPVRLIR